LVWLTAIILLFSPRSSCRPRMVPLLPLLRSDGADYAALPFAQGTPVSFVRVLATERCRSGEIEFEEISVDASAPRAGWAELREAADWEAMRCTVAGKTAMNATALLLPEEARADVSALLAGVRPLFRKPAFRRLVELLAAGSLRILFAGPALLDQAVLAPQGQAQGAWEPRGWMALAGLLSRLELLGKLRATRTQERRGDVEAFLQSVSALWASLGGVPQSRKRAAGDDDEEEELSLQQTDDRRCKRARSVAADHCRLSLYLADLQDELAESRLRENLRGRNRRVRELLALIKDEERRMRKGVPGPVPPYAEELQQIYSSAAPARDPFSSARTTFKSVRSVAVLKRLVAKTRLSRAAIDEEHAEWERLYTLEAAAAERIRALEDAVARRDSERSEPAPVPVSVPAAPSLTPQQSELVQRILATAFLPAETTDRQRLSAILGRSERSGDEEMKMAFKQLSLAIHADKLGPDCHPFLHGLLANINALRYRA
jgi:hypothetical protein